MGSQISSEDSSRGQPSDSFYCPGVNFSLQIRNFKQKEKSDISGDPPDKILGFR